MIAPGGCLIDRAITSVKITPTRLVSMHAVHFDGRLLPPPPLSVDDPP